ncbi:hypothetical protein [Pseudonocardia parietis]|uniref:Uncharacterized protein n=1 Tax=Pseudonocardia parietis TaxID=570936 RepID=A0ABS4VSI5_9PSEU|nr:hypothetical protein [Pseudonocardia parietis]MBP2366886.1 hypothetical protein [Pseudonocardia parietis]
MSGPLVVGIPAVAPRGVRAGPTVRPDQGIAAVELKPDGPATPGGRAVAAVERIPVVDAVPPAGVAVRGEPSEFVAIAGTTAPAVAGTASAIVAGRGGVG